MQFITFVPKGKQFVLRFHTLPRLKAKSPSPRRAETVFIRLHACSMRHLADQENRSAAPAHFRSGLRATFDLQTRRPRQPAVHPAGMRILDPRGLFGMTTGYLIAMPAAGRAPASRPHGTMRTAHVLVVDDDPETRDDIGRYLEGHGFSVATVPDRARARRHLAMTEPRLIVLGMRVGPDHGLDILREIRSNSGVPIILLMDDRPDEADAVIALEAGADAYMVKPVSLRKLLAVVRAILRRQQMERLGQSREAERGGYKFEGWRLERRGRRLFDPCGTLVPLTKGQYALLVAFLDAPQRSLTREYLLHATRVHEDIFDRSVDVQVTRLRRKLEPSPDSPKMILAQRGVGYVMTCDVERY
jgi:two-component system, OmpR family, response regulator